MPHGRAAKGVLLRYLEHMTGLSRQQVTRLVRQYRQDGALSPQHGFLRRFTATDVALLADMDTLHGTVSGPATKKLMERALLILGMRGCTAGGDFGLSPVQPARRDPVPAHAAALDQGAANGRAHRSAPRLAPQPNGMPGYIRIDSVHQGDQDGVKGVYHINAVDCVTQFHLVATSEKISKAYLLPVIRQLLEGFSFTILWFHADNGSEYINYQVATLLETLRIEFTKSRSGTPTITPWQSP